MDTDKRKKIINGDDNKKNIVLSSSTSSSSSISTNNIEQQQQQVLQSVPSQEIKDRNKSSNGQILKSSLPSSKTEEDVTVVRMRNKPLPEIQEQIVTDDVIFEANGNNKGNSHAILQHGLEVLNETVPEDDGNEEIRRLDSQLDHLNHYMDKVEERIKEHNEKLMVTLRHQKEEREKRRRSFHERVALNQQEDNDFQRQISTLLNRVDISKNRASMYDIISQMEIPKSKGQ